MDRELLRHALAKFLGGLVVICLILLLPAGTLRFWRAWVFVCALFVPMLAAGAIMLKRAPDLLRKRLQTDEGEPEQRTVILLSGLMFLSMPLVLGSPISFLVMLLYVPIIAKRIENEEKVLERGLAGYADYKTKVHFKVIPFVW